MTITVPFYVPERGINAIYRFFKDEALRFYLYDIFGPNNVIRAGTTGTNYNPYVVYLIYKHNIKYLNNITWWSKNKHKVMAKDQLEKIVTKWNEEHDEKLSDGGQVRDMIKSSFIKWQESLGSKFPRYAQFKKGENLNDFFGQFFPQHVVEEQLVDETMIVENANSNHKENDMNGDDIVCHEIVIEEHLVDEDHYMSELNNDNSYGTDYDIEMVDVIESTTGECLSSNDDACVDGSTIGECLSSNDDACVDGSTIGECLLSNHDNCVDCSTTGKCPSSNDDDHKILELIRLNDHKRQFSLLNSKNYMCDQCGKSFTQKNNFSGHLIRIHDQFLCATCDMIFLDVNEFVQHKNVEHNEPSWLIILCDVCGKSLPRNGLKKVYHTHFMNKKTLKQRKDHSNYKRVRNLITCKACKVYFNSSEERKEHEKIHLKKPCDICELFISFNILTYIKHRKTCSPYQKLKLEQEVMTDMREAFEFFQSKSSQLLASSSTIEHTKPLLEDSILFRINVSGNLEFDSRDGFPLWREDLYVPIYGSFSYVNSKMSSNDTRNNNIMHPFTFKVYMHDIFPIGKSVLIKFNSLARVPEYSFQLFNLNTWKHFKTSGLGLNRNKLQFTLNKDFPRFMQRKPELYGNNMDRGHLTPYYMACSTLDQSTFQLQGNIFPQMAPMNRGKWKSLERSIPVKMKSNGAFLAHITTGIVYARDKNGGFVNENGIFKVESYFKVIFYADSHNKPFELNCFMVNQYPIPDDHVSQVTLFDIESIKNNHLIFLNPCLLKSLPPKVLDYHKVSMKEHKKA